MEAAQIRYHALLGLRDWHDAKRTDLGSGASEGSANLYWDSRQNGLTLMPRPLQGPGAARWPGGARGAARDGLGRWFWLAPDGGSIRMQEPDGGAAITFWPVDAAERPMAPGSFRPRQPEGGATQLRGMVVTPTQHLVVATVAPPGLLAFDLAVGGAPAFTPLPDGALPCDLAVNGRQLLVLESAPRARYWRFGPGVGSALPGRQSEEEPGVGPLFQPTVADGASLPSEGPRWRSAGERARAVDGAEAFALGDPEPLAIEALPDGSILLLSGAQPGAPARVTRYRGAQAIASADLLLPMAWVDRGGLGSMGGHGPRSNPGGLGPTSRAPAGESLERYAPQAYDLAFVPDARRGERRTGTLYVAATDLGQCLAFTCSFGASQMEVEPSPRYLPMVGAIGLGLATGGQQPYYGTATGWVPLLERPCPRHVSQGSVQLFGLDGRQEGCVWHRLLLDAIIPVGTAVQVEVRASDEPTLPETIPWAPEPAPYLRAAGAELDWYQPFSEAEQAMGRAGTWELLFQHAQGRYLQIRLTLTGNRGRSPLVRAARVYYPRYSYLVEHLPQTYRDDAASASFLERFVANAEGIQTDIGRRMDSIHHLLAPRAVPGEYLDWLASWYGYIMEAGWEERRKRIFLSHAAALFARRGTVDTLVRMIRLATDPFPTERIFREATRPYTGLSLPGVVTPFRIVEGFWDGSARPPTPGGEDDHPSAGFGIVGEGLGSPARDGAVVREYWEFRRNWGRVHGRRPSHDGRRQDGDEPAADPTGNDLADGPRTEFIQRFLPTIRGAHRFTIFVALRLEEEGPRPAVDLEALQAVVRREKPAHTVAEIRPDLPGVRVGESSLGIGTTVGPGSRLVAMVLGRGPLGGSYIL